MLSKLLRMPRSTEQQWLHYGHWHNLIQELRLEDAESYISFMRMKPPLPSFDEILRRIYHRIRKKDTNWSKALPPGLKLAVAQKYLATVDQLWPMIPGPDGTGGHRL